MRELGEGMRRIFELMKSNELAPPNIESDGETFSLSLFHRAMYSQEETLWLEQYTSFGLSAEQKAIVLLGMKGALIAPQDIWDRLGLVDTEHYRLLVSSLQTLGILETGRTKQAAKNYAKQAKISMRAVPRFRIKLAKDIGPTSARKSAVKPQLEHRATERRSAPQKAVSRSASARLEGRSLFVGNLPPNVTDRDMIAVFEPFGTIEAVHVPKSGHFSRGYGFVEFETLAAAQKLLRDQPLVRMGPYRLALRPAKPRITH